MTQLSLILVKSLSSVKSRSAQKLILVAGASLTVGWPAVAHSQAITIDTKTMNSVGPMVDRRYAQVEPTKISLPEGQIDARGHQDILRVLTAEQGFAMRPLPRGKKGLTLAANGKLSPADEGYIKEISEQGLSVKPGDRVVLSNVRIDKERIVFDINGGPEHKHEFMRHIQIGMGGPGNTNSVVQDPDQEPTGSRVSLTFSKYVPNVTPAQIKALLAPLISFDVKSPAQAYTDTLPPTLKAAILNHHVLVGMNTDMVLYAMGQPESKSRELEGQMPFEEWIYGHPPQDVNFVRVNGNRVIRVEVAKLGQPLEVFTKDEVAGLMMTDGRSVEASLTQEHKIQMGDVHRDPNTQAAEAPPSLRAPGEKLPTDAPVKQDPQANRVGAMQPVVFPKDTTKDPARTVPAHPKPTAPPEDEDADGDSKTSTTTTRPAYDGKPGDAPAPADQTKPAATTTNSPASANPKNLLTAATF